MPAQRRAGDLHSDPGSLAAVSGGGVTVALTPADLILTGSIADLNAFLAAGNLTFTTAVHDTAPVLLRIIVNDLGHSGSGGAGEETAYVDLVVTPVNDPPAITSDGGGASASLRVAENATAVTTVASTDLDGGTPVLGSPAGPTPPGPPSTARRVC